MNDTTENNTQTINVKVSQLDQLLNLTGEMIINNARLELARKELQTFFQRQSPMDKNTLSMVRNTASAATKISSELQSLVMRVRMVPVSNLFQRFPRVVRDFSRNSGKDIELVLEGEDTLVDRTILEQIADPLMHQIRNAMDHGIEEAGVREAKGKTPSGRVCLRAKAKDKHVYLEIEDDGKGLDVEAIRNKAVERGLCSSAEAAKLKDEEVFRFIFQAGFSTAKAVTDVSGRGVGMDVVRAGVEKLKGEILIQSFPGKGSCFTIKLPVVTAVNIIECLIVEDCGELFAIPLSAVVEVLTPKRIKTEKLFSKDEIILYRGQTLRVVDLETVLGFPMRQETPRDRFMVVIGDQKNQLGLRVDTLHSPQQVVLTRLEKYFGVISGIAGATILSGERVGMILNTAQIFELVFGSDLEAETPSKNADEPSKSATPVDIESLIRPVVVSPEALTAVDDILAGLGAGNAKATEQELDPMQLAVIAELEGKGKSPVSVPEIKSSTPSSGNSVDDVLAGMGFELQTGAGENLNASQLAVIAELEGKGEEPSGVEKASPVALEISWDDIPEKIGLPNRAEEKVASAEFVTEDMVRDFLHEIDGHLNLLGKELILLEKKKNDADLVNSLFRAFHSIKGAMNMMGYKEVGYLTHGAENLLDDIRKGEEEVSTAIVDVLLDTVDELEKSAGQIREGHAAEVRNPGLLFELSKLRDRRKQRSDQRAKTLALEPFEFNELQNLWKWAARAKGEHFYEILVNLGPDGKDNSGLAMAALRKLCARGQVLAVQPALELIESQPFGSSIKIYFATPATEEELQRLSLESLRRELNIEEAIVFPAT